MRPLVRIGILVATLLATIVVGGPAEAAPASVRPFEIVTIPPTPEARFALDGQELVTDDRGVAHALVPPSTGAHRVELLNPTTSSPDGTSEFIRWHGHGDADQGHTPVLDNLRIDHRLRLQVAFQKKRSFRFAFVDQNQRPVDAQRISAVTVRSDANRTDTVPGPGALDLVTVRPGVGDGPPVAKESTYSVQSVTIDGTNVVNVGEQRFRPAQGQPVLQIVVLLRSVHFRVRDRLLGTPVATTVTLTYPDGRQVTLPTDRDGELVLQNLGRGTYRVSAEGQAYAVDQELALSRSQFVDLSVVTYVDALLAAGTALVALVALLWVGAVRARRHRFVQSLQRADPPVGVPDAAVSVPDNAEVPATAARTTEAAAAAPEDAPPHPGSEPLEPARRPAGAP